MLLPIKDYNPTRKAAVLTLVFIALNIMVFIYGNFFQKVPSRYQKLMTPLQYHNLSYGFIPREMTRQQQVHPVIPYGRMDQLSGIIEVHKAVISRSISPWLSLLFAMFMHGSFWHLAGNMLFLWIFGNNIEDHLGILKFFGFYMLGGIGAGLFHMIFNWNSTTPVVGASGAVSAVMGAYLLLFPRARVKTLVMLFFLITFIDIPAAVFLIVWFAFQFLNIGGDSGIAWIAHVGGFLLGILLILILKPPEKTLRIH